MAIADCGIQRNSHSFTEIQRHRPLLHRYIDTHVTVIELMASAIAVWLFLATAAFGQTSSIGDAASPISVTTEPITSTNIARRILNDERRIWTLPQRLVQGHCWTTTVIVTGATIGLTSVDSSVSSYFRRSPVFGNFNSAFSARSTSLTMAIIPASFFAAGLARNNSYDMQTALLAGEAVLNAEILTSVMKNIDHRLRPIAAPSGGTFGGGWFSDRGLSLGGKGSFPSGHATAAFALAAVFAQRYRTHRWVPCAAYGLASVIAFSRVSLLSHYASDVFLGAALGISISRIVVFTDRRS